MGPSFYFTKFSFSFISDEDDEDEGDEDDDDGKFEFSHHFIWILGSLPSKFWRKKLSQILNFTNFRFVLTKIRFCFGENKGRIFNYFRFW